MNSYKLALIGHKIEKSLSPVVYRNLLADQLGNYELLDTSDLSSLEELTTLLTRFDGLSVTAPFKHEFFKKCDQVSTIAAQCEAVNSLRINNGIVEGDLTDAYAAQSILEQLCTHYPQLDIAILGDGSMSRLLELLLNKANKKYTVHSRKKGWGKLFVNKGLFINTCLKEAIFPSSPSIGSVVWDLNYGYESSLNIAGVEYYDGKEMLIKQAESALSFWNIPH